MKEVTQRFGGLIALTDFSIAIEDHTLVGLIGPNGAGKTTAFNLASTTPPRGRSSLTATFTTTSWSPTRSQPWVWPAPSRISASGTT